MKPQPRVLTLLLVFATIAGCAVSINQQPSSPKAQVVEKTTLSQSDESWVIETFPTRPKPVAGAAGMWSTPSLGSSYFGTTESSSDLGKLEIRFINVGQGDTTAIKCPNGRVIIVDVGGSENPKAVAPPPSFKLGQSRADAAKESLDELIGKEKKVHALFLTHPDRDHYNGLGTVLDGVSVEHVFVSGFVEEYKTKGAKAWLNGKNVTPHFSDETPPIDCKPATIRVLTAKPTPPPATPPKKRSSHERNTLSLVLLIAHGEADFVLAADATKTTKSDILDKLGDSAARVLDSEVLKVAHHGADNTLDTTWLGKIKPSIALLSSMQGHRYGHPRVKVVDALANVPVVRANAHKLSVYGGKSCKENVKSDDDGGEETIDVACDDKGWRTHDDYGKAIFNVGELGTVIVTSDGKTITTKYRGNDGEQAASREKPQQLTDEQKEARCSAICVERATPCATYKRTDDNGRDRYGIQCHYKTDTKRYNECIAKATPDRHIWEQCAR